MANFSSEQLSKELAKILGGEYNEEAHWTSPLRGNHGVREYPSDDVCSFTIKDSECSGKWTKAVAAAQYYAARGWLNSPPTWHIEVKTVVSLSDKFVLSDRHFELARRKSVTHQEQQNRRIPTDAVMLVIVYDVKDEPKFQMYPDPWNLYLRGLLRMKPTSNFVSSLPLADKM